MPELVDVAVIGGGLSGLSLADQLHRAGLNFHVFEARGRFGGRMHVHNVEGTAFDIGPSWFWPGQPRLADMVRRFDLTVFEQYADGALTYETESGEVQRGRGYASMQGSYRLQNGMPTLTDHLAANLPRASLSRSVSISQLAQNNGMVRLLTADGTDVGCARRVVLAVPPRVAATLHYAPSLSAAAIDAMQQVPTWMAGQAKYLAVYERPFWRDMGLSGDAMSRLGPMVEVHDASDPASGLGALFGFIGVPAAARNTASDGLQEACRVQLGRLFAEEALRPLSHCLQDWATQPETATPLDQQSPQAHPSYGLPSTLSNLWNGQLMLGSTEVASTFGGYLEGALEAADHVFQTLTAGTDARVEA